MLHVSFITLLPEAFPGPLSLSLCGKALSNKIWSYKIFNLRDFGKTKHRNVDDIQYGGGSGLVMRPDVIGDAIDAALQLTPMASIYYMSPRGALLTQSFAKELSQKSESIIILCGRFEGIDERIIEEYNVCTLSIGDYILSGGEIAAMALVDSVVRLMPGVVENRNSLNEESFESDSLIQGMLEYPLYTRPKVWKERIVPNVLLSGNHKLIKDWRYEQAKSVTAKYRPTLLKEKMNND